MENEGTEITDKGIIVMGNLGKLIYRIFIIVMLYNIYTHLMGESTTLAICSFLIIFPLLWMTMKELSADMNKHDNKSKNHDSEELATSKTISTEKE